MLSSWNNVVSASPYFNVFYYKSLQMRQQSCRIGIIGKITCIFLIAMALIKQLIVKFLFAEEM